MKKLLLTLNFWLYLSLLPFTAYASPVAGNMNIVVEVADVSDPAAIKIKTSDQGVVVCGTLHDCIANYPQLKDGMIAETTKKLESEDEITAQHRMQILIGQKIDIPIAVLSKHNVRIQKFTKAKEDALNAAIKKAQVAVKIDSGMSVLEIAAAVKAVNDAQALLDRANVKKNELIAAGIPISDATKKAVESAQPKATPTAAPTVSATPSDGL